MNVAFKKIVKSFNIFNDSFSIDKNIENNTGMNIVFDEDTWDEQ